MYPTTLPLLGCFPSAVMLGGHTLARATERAPTLPALTLAAETKIILYLIFKKAINKTVKHAEAKNVEVRIPLEGGTLRMEV